MTTIEGILTRKLPQFPRVVEFLTTSYTDFIENGVSGVEEEFWQNYEEILEEISAISGLTCQEIYEELKRFQIVRSNCAPIIEAQPQESRFGLVREKIYEQDAYPILEHFYFAYAPYTIQRKEFVIQQVQVMNSQPSLFCDLGVGPGVLFSRVLREQQNWMGYGVDISAKCVAYAKKMVDFHHLSHRAFIIQADVRSTPYEANFFDVVIASEVLEHIPDPKVGLRELTRILKLDGSAMIALPICLEQPEHLYVFRGEDECKKACEDVGLHIEHFEKWESGGAFIDSFAVCRKVALNPDEIGEANY